MSDASKVSAEVNGAEPFAEARGWTAGEVIERANGAVTDHCRAEMKPPGRSAMYRDCIHACLDQLRTHMEKPSNNKLTDAGTKTL
jgi:hypothetical protein